MSTYNLWCANSVMNIFGYALGIVVGIGMVYAFTSLSLDMLIENN